jgi:hypothetical protein
MPLSMAMTRTFDCARIKQKMKRRSNRGLVAWLYIVDAGAREGS